MLFDKDEKNILILENVSEPKACFLFYQAKVNLELFQHSCKELHEAFERLRVARGACRHFIRRCL